MAKNLVSRTQGQNVLIIGAFVMIAIMGFLVLSHFGWIQSPYMTAALEADEAVPIGVGGEEVETGKLCKLGERAKIRYHGVDYAKPGTTVGSNSATLYEVYDKDDGTTIYKQALSSLADDTEYSVAGYQKYALHVTKSGCFDTYVDFIMPCQLLYTVPGEEGEGSNILRADIDTSASVYFFNDEYTKIAQNSTEVDFSANAESKSLMMRIKGGETDGYVTSPYHNKVIITLKFDTASDYDTKLTQIEGCTSIAVPRSQAEAHMAFECPCDVSGTGSRDYVFDLVAASGAYASDSEDITVNLLQFDYFTGEDGYVKFGVDDDTGTGVQTNISAALPI